MPPRIVLPKGGAGDKDEHYLRSIGLLVVVLAESNFSSPFFFKGVSPF